MLSALRIDFDPGSQLVLNLLLAAMMFGVALGLKPADFGRILRQPRAPAGGLLAQFLILPALTWGLTMLLPMAPGVALGMILVASCPGGSFSNILTWLARGNVAVSVSMTATSSLAALVLTPLNFAFWGSLNPDTAQLLSQIAVAPTQILTLVLAVLGLPLLCGMILGYLAPALAARIQSGLKPLSLAIFLVFVGIALFRNGALFRDHFTLFAGFVVLHNAMALLLGWSLARGMKLPDADSRAVTLEVGIQNSGLGLIILFNFFPEQGGMMVITAFWGVWHLISGLLMMAFWRYRDQAPGHTPSPAGRW